MEIALHASAAYYTFVLVGSNITLSWTLKTTYVICNWHMASLFSKHIRYLLSPVRLSVVCNVHAPYSGGSNFRQYFYGIRYLGLPLTSTEIFSEIVPGEALRQGS